MAINEVKSAARGAVIGAGMAGLSCATVLRASGLSVRLFEKSGGPRGCPCAAGGAPVVATVRRVGRPGAERRHARLLGHHAALCGSA
ncbi:MAG: NAD(P)-binding protein [Sulfuritalea sp.]|nr:NAD(P)-binding protein [Sulfuritalea sp.]